MRPIFLFSSIILLGHIQAVQGELLNPDEVYLLLGSSHQLQQADSFDYNEENPGLLLVWNNVIGTLDMTAGLYENSFSDISGLVGLAKRWPISADAEVGLLMAISNYETDDPIFQPLGGGLVVIPALQLNWRHFFIQAIPVPDPDNTGVVFSYGLRFDLGS